MRIFNLSNKSGSLTSSDKFVLDNGTNVMKIDYNALAKAIIEQYTGSSLAGSAQSVKAALDSLNSKSNKCVRTAQAASNDDAILELPIAHGLLVVMGATSTTRGLYVLSCYSSTSIEMLEIKAPSEGTITVSGNKVILHNSTSWPLRAAFIGFM